MCVFACERVIGMMCELGERVVGCGANGEAMRFHGDQVEQLQP